MTKPDTPTALARAAQISMPYANQIWNGVRKPSRRMAIQIFRRTGWKPRPIDTLTDEEIAILEQVEGRPA